MSCEQVTVFFPESEATIKAKQVSSQDIRDDEAYLVDKDHNADIILKPVGDKPLPKGRWQIEE